MALTIALALVALSFSTAFAGLHPAPTVGDDWPTARGSADNRGVASGAPVVVERLLWKVRIGGVASCEPVVQGGLLYYSGFDRGLEVLDVRTGRSLYHERFNGPISGVLPRDSIFAVVADQDESRFIVRGFDPVLTRWAFHISACRAAPRWLSDSTVLLACLDGRVFCHTMSGRTVWTSRCDGPIFNAPAVSDSMVFVAGGHQVVALSAADGHRLWSHRASGPIVAAPAVDDRVYVGSADSIVYALSRTSGVMEWFYAAEGGVFTTPTIGSDRLFFGANDGKIYAIDKAAGHLLWRYDTGEVANLSMTLSGVTLFAASPSGRLLLLDASTGTLLREFPLDAPAVMAPVVAEGMVFVSDAKRRLYCFGASGSASNEK